MDMDINDENYTLTIRCGLQSFDDFTLLCPKKWTVEQLKHKIAEECPLKPEPSRQRLIFAGHCLCNSRTIMSVFEHRHVDSGVYVIHLVCPPKNMAELDELRRRKVKKVENRTNASPCTTTSSRNRGSSGNNRTATATPAAPSVNLAMNLQSNPFCTQDFFNLYQSYMAAYNNYIQQTILNTGTTLQTQNSAIPPLNAWQIQTDSQQAAHVEEPNVAAPPVQNEAPAAGGMVQEALFIDADAPQMEQRDFLDVIYKAIRIGFLVMLVYLYSSAERFLGVLFFILVVWFVQARRDRYVRQRGNNRLLIPAPAENQEEGENRSNTNTSGEVAGQIDNFDYREPTAWRVFWSTCYSFISSFFLSLLPDNPIQVVN